jgi:CHAT domain-containing protein
MADSDRPGWCLSDEISVLYVPSLGIASEIARYVNGGSHRLLMVGYAGSDLPGVREEIQAIAGVWRGECTVLDGSECNKLRVLEELRKPYDFNHFAGHGSFDYFHPEQSAFYFRNTGGRRELGDAYRLTAHDLLAVRFPAHPVVTLSACSSGITAYDAIHRLTGLSGSLFQIGARVVIGSRWPVSDATALKVMCAIYSSIAAGSTPFAGFLKAQSSLRANSAIEDWSAFGYVGLA